MSDTMNDAQHTEDGAPLITLAGEVDLSHADALLRTALRALDTSDRLVVDTSQVTFLDSAILGALVRVHRAAEERGATFSLVRPSKVVLRLLRLTGLDERLHVEPA
jgi:anti-sigma B factor antagonist